MTTHETDMTLPVGLAPAPADAAPAKTKVRRRRRSTFWRVREEIPRSRELALLMFSVLSPLALWSALSYPELVNPIFLPTPDKVATAGYDMLMDGTLTSDMLASSQRVAIGFGLSLLIAIPLGLAMGTFRSISALFEPVIGLVRYAPATAFVPLLLIWLGVCEAAKIALVLIGTVFFNTLMIANVVWQVPSELIRVSQ